MENDDNKAGAGGNPEPIIGGGAPEVTYPDWVKSQPEDIREGLKGYASAEDAFRDALSMKAKLAEGGLRAPGKDGTPEEWEAFYKARRGGVSGPEKYSFDASEERLGKMGVSRKEYESFTKELFAKGIPDEIHGDVMAALEKTSAEELNALRNARAIEAENTKAALMREWGAENYGRNIDAVNKLLAKYPGVGKAIAENGLGTNEALIRMLHAFAQESTEGGIAGEGERGDPDAMLKALKESDEYKDVEHPGHAAAMKREFELYRMKARALARGR